MQALLSAIGVGETSATVLGATFQVSYFGNLSIHISVFMSSAIDDGL